MNSSTIENLRKEAEKHRKIADKISQFLIELEAFEKGEEQLSQPTSTLAEALELPNNPFVTSVTNGSHKGHGSLPYGRFKHMTQAQAVEEVLKIKKAASARVIFEELKEGGLVLPHVNYVSTILSRRKDLFRSLGHGSWTLLEPIELPLTE